MAKIKLSDVIEVMKSKWTYGDSIFGYTEEFNDNHNTKYPSLLITPPDSVFPEVGEHSGWEEYSFEVFASDLYNRTAQQNENIEKRWDNLQDLASMWLERFLRFYQKDAPIQAFLEDESVTVERSKEVANDKLIQIKLSFTFKIYSQNFRPLTDLPDDISDLIVWLPADSGVDYSIATKRVSSWTNQADTSQKIIAQATTTSQQPLRFTYDGADDKTRINFNGTSQYFISNLPAPITANDFTIFAVYKYADLSNTSQKIFTVKEFLPNTNPPSGVADRILLGINSLGRPFLKVEDDLDNEGQVDSTTSSDKFSIVNASCKKNIGVNGSTIRIQLNDNAETSDVVADFNNNNTGFDDTEFYIGFARDAQSNGYLKGDICEIILYNRALDSFEIEKVKNYLNDKFKIY